MRPLKNKKPIPEKGEIVLYQGEDGALRVECRFQEGTICLPQKLIAELFQVSVATVNEGELASESTIRKFRMVQTEGSRQVERLVDYYGEGKLPN